MKAKKAILLAFLVALLMSAVACGGGAGEATPTSTPQSTPIPRPADPSTAQRYLEQVQVDDYLDVEDWDKSIAAYTEALKLDPNSAVAYVSRMFAYNQKVQHDQAIANCNKVTQPDLVAICP